MIIRSEKGVFVACASGWYAHAANALTAEAITARDGIQLAISRGINKLVVESGN